MVDIIMRLRAYGPYIYLGLLHCVSLFRDAYFAIFLRHVPTTKTYIRVPFGGQDHEWVSTGQVRGSDPWMTSPSIETLAIWRVKCRVRPIPTSLALAFASQQSHWKYGTRPRQTTIPSMGCRSADFPAASGRHHYTGLDRNSQSCQECLWNRGCTCGIWQEL